MRAELFCGQSCQEWKVIYPNNGLANLQRVSNVHTQPSSDRFLTVSQPTFIYLSPNRF